MKLKQNQSKLYHSKKWRDFRIIFLRDNYKCKLCDSTLSLEIDHIVEHVENEWLFYNKKNLQTLCKPCHFVKTMKDKKILSFPNSIKKIFVDNSKDLEIEDLEKFYTWKRDNELTKIIVLNIIKNNNPNLKVFNLNIKDLEFWKIKKILDAFCFELKEIPEIIFLGENLKLNDFLIKLLETLESNI